MLTELSISGLGVIDRAVAEFSPGLSVLTGETGAGKTMVVTGLRLLTGSRADASRVRKGADRAFVEGRFALGDVAGSDRQTSAAVVDEIDGETDEDGSVIASRRVSQDGRSRGYLAGRSVPVGTLGRFCSPLLAVHGQNDQLRLLQPEKQRDAVDTYGGAATEKALKKYRAVYAEWKTAEKDLARRNASAREMAQEADMLRMGLGEIEDLDPQPGEDADLDTQIRRLTDSEELRLAASSAHVALTEGDEAASVPAIGSQLDQLSMALRATEDPELISLSEQMAEAVVTLSDVGNELGGFLSQLDVDADSLENALARRHALKGLTRKYGEDIDGVLAWADSARRKLDGLDTSDEAMNALKGEVKRLREEIVAVGRELTAARKKAATKLAKAVSGELAELSMGGAKLEVRVEPASSGPEIGGVVPTEVGLDSVRMLLSGAAGAVPLEKGASGGELSRVMLALEVVLAGNTSGGTLVFDEVDAGVGGKAALSIGKRLAMLAENHQVLAVTHLAQVAAFADTHLVVRKSSGASSIISGVEAVEGEERVRELARMLAGMDDSDSGLAHAKDLLDKAQGDSR
ncbi:MAG TPA: DNA repair protein RecN [Dietzia timorensis]|uniref:DNA repair protein RecN n=1 Tax=Dietzia timorensis TaxID=499555 RepID=A0A921F3D9_9ACTN|nr:DNA repair protein RecN [Dietzia timorensis]HJE90987.1 DNA repair protein RecN [Dietzia timorensis]